MLNAFFANISIRSFLLGFFIHLLTFKMILLIKDEEGVSKPPKIIALNLLTVMKKMKNLLVLLFLTNISTIGFGCVYSKEFTTGSVNMSTAINDTVKNFELLSGSFALFSRHNKEIEKIIGHTYNFTRTIEAEYLHNIEILQKANLDLENKLSAVVSKLSAKTDNMEERIGRQDFSISGTNDRTHSVEAEIKALRSEVDSLSSRTAKTLSGINEQLQAVKQLAAAVVVTSNGGGQPLCRWVRSKNGENPSNAVEAGYDDKGEKLFVARVRDELSAVIPGKFVPSQRKAYVAWSYTEIAKDDYEILTDCLPQWQSMMGGQTPKNALVVGHNRDNSKQFYVGRVKHGKSLIPGRVHEGEQNCYYSDAGKEFNTTNFEIMVV